MSIFGKIKDAIFGNEDRPTEQPQPSPTPAPAGTAAAEPAPPGSGEPATVINIENSLDSMPGADRLNWRTSIIDLMTLINVDSDYDSRKALAVEMGRDDYAGSAEDNVWLHRRVMQELGGSGGVARPR